jgi:hypothetical protein
VARNMEIVSTCCPDSGIASDITSEEKDSLAYSAEERPEDPSVFGIRAMD